MLMGLEYQLLSGMMSKGFLRVVYSSQYEGFGVPVFTMGYRDFTQEALATMVKESRYDCRSVRFKLSYSGHDVYQEIEAYCESDPSLISREAGGLIDLFGKELTKNNAISSVRLEKITYHDNGEHKNGIVLFLLSVLFVVLIIVSMPWALFQIKEE